ncbi:ferritin-like domain-containing protein [Romboutsia sedimentorum]|uniref:Ferritin-like domain-containing protein n=1 Tax=Romboutsia sedimentorum TaxID=1368474 RepID=A0ABT7E6L6_9FIRM|nr:ferritin-like domain-containing protein [Romboutsia sedimentorum]MDK2562556.1 ferritin-like domain-containing protein [Romboutsia sedimentorum]MDK2584798.1 ferritin-like domain-containing protein [Romboutsia sedimentorum]
MFNYNYPTSKSFINSVNLMQQSVEGEKSDALFYEWLINNIPTDILTKKQSKSIKDTIESIREDEISHNKMFKQMYSQLTGIDAAPVEEEFIPPENFIEGIIKALNGELNAVKRYRQIMNGMPNLYFRDNIFNILTDELRHASLYNYIYTTVLDAQKQTK